MNRQLALLLASVFFLFALWKSCHRAQDEKPVIPPDVTPSEPVTAVREATPTEAPPPVESDAAETSSPAVPQMDAAALRSRFAAAMAQSGTCTGLNMNPGTDSVEPQLDNWMNQVKPELGEPVLQSEDRSIVEILTPNGEHRRIRVEMDYTTEDRIVRRVHYEKQNGEGGVDSISLTPEQSEEPSDTFLASLEADGQVIHRDRSQRIYFAGGEEIVANERDGHISEIEMSRLGKTFKCRMDAAAGTEPCTCQ